MFIYFSLRVQRRSDVWNNGIDASITELRYCAFESATIGSNRIVWSLVASMRQRIGARSCAKTQKSRPRLINLHEENIRRGANHRETSFSLALRNQIAPYRSRTYRCSILLPVSPIPLIAGRVVACNRGSISPTLFPSVSSFRRLASGCERVSARYTRTRKDYERPPLRVIHRRVVNLGREPSNISSFFRCAVLTMLSAKETRLTFPIEVVARKEIPLAERKTFCTTGAEVALIFLAP